MLSSDSSKTNRKDTCRLIETPAIEIVSEQTALLLGLDEVEETLVDISAEDFESGNSANENECHEKLEEANDIKSTLCLAPESAAAAIAALVLSERLLASANVGLASGIQRVFDVVLGTLEDDKATDAERRRTSPMQRWTSQLRSSDPWCSLRIAPTVEQHNKRRKEVADKNEQKTEESTRDCLSSENSSEVGVLKQMAGATSGHSLGAESCKTVLISIAMPRHRGMRLGDFEPPCMNSPKCRDA